MNSIKIVIKEAGLIGWYFQAWLHFVSKMLPPFNELMDMISV
jgi:hypothetical protein